MMDDPIYYLNGDFVPASQAALPLADLGIMRGYGVFDYLRLYQRVPFHLAEHVGRLAHSAAQIGLSLPCSQEEITHLVHETIGRNPALTEGGVRLVATGGISPNLFEPQEGHASLAVMMSPPPSYPSHCYTEGIKVITTRIDRELPTVKSLNYIGAIMVMRQAAQVGAHEALYISAEDDVLECTRANFFGLRGRQLIVPAGEMLLGITRQVALTLAADWLEIVERPLPLTELAQLDEAFVTSSTKEIMPVRQVDDQLIGTGQVGPYTRQLMQLFDEYVSASVGQAL